MFLIGERISFVRVTLTTLVIVATTLGIFVISITKVEPQPIIAKAQAIKIIHVIDFFINITAVGLLLICSSVLSRLIMFCNLITSYGSRTYQ
jgi:hypothetical protein